MRRTRTRAIGTKEGEVSRDRMETHSIRKGIRERGCNGVVGGKSQEERERAIEPKERAGVGERRVGETVEGIKKGRWRRKRVHLQVREQRREAN